ncbi:MAG: hypothetical protein LIO92_08355 [Clostridiales bacterium]|nr:hypothetical protein [Clostridiales bacterium]
MAGVFRKSAMERLSSPDQLDSMLKITSPMSWLGIGAAAFLAAAVLIWSFVGTWDTTLSVPAVLAYSYHTNTIFSTAYGEVSEILVDVGERIEEGTPVVCLSMPDGGSRMIVSDQEGTISAVLTEEGAQTMPNGELFRVSPLTDHELSLVCYVDLSTMRQLEKGMEVSVYPDFLDAGTYGHMTAMITNIDSCPASDAAMSEILGDNSPLLETLSQYGGLAAVTCELETDDTTASGYAFSNVKGSSVMIMAGETAEARIVMERQTPIEKVFPMLGGS